MKLKKNINTQTTDVYVVGNVEDDGIFVVVYWKNGVCTKLSDGKHSCYATGIAVIGNDVYASGNYETDNGNVVPVCWKNGAEKRLTDGTFWARSNDIAVDDRGNVYVVGSIDADLPMWTTAVYWKNGNEATELSPGMNSAAFAVAINETGVYIAGCSNGQAVYWKDGLVTNLSKEFSDATAIVLNGADVYIAGMIVKPVTLVLPVYWKNNDEAIPFKGTFKHDEFIYYNVNAIAVNNNHDVYAGGDRFPVWKNDTCINLTDGARINSIVQSGDDLYIAGAIITTDIEAAVYWKNGIINYLPGGIHAKDIVVVTRP